MFNSKNYFIGTFIIITIVISNFVLKNIAISLIETNLSKLLQQRVQVTTFNLFPLNITLFIKTRANTLDITLNKLYPPEVDVMYGGDLDAFGAYHPLKGTLDLGANIIYDDALYIDADILLYGSQSKLKVNNLDDKFNISLEVNQLDIENFKVKNSYDFNVSGYLDSRISLVLDNNDTLLKMTLNHEKIRSDKLNAEYNLGNGVFSLDSSIEIVDIQARPLFRYIS